MWLSIRIFRSLPDPDATGRVRLYARSIIRRASFKPFEIYWCRGASNEGDISCVAKAPNQSMTSHAIIVVHGDVDVSSRFQHRE